MVDSSGSAGPVVVPAEVHAAVERWLAAPWRTPRELAIDLAGEIVDGEWANYRSRSGHEVIENPWAQAMEALDEFAEAQEVARVARNYDWPDEWPPGFVMVWRDLGGMLESALAWAAAGWHPEEVLAAPTLTRDWNAEVSDRVCTLNPPGRPSDLLRWTPGLESADGSELHDTARPSLFSY